MSGSGRGRAPARIRLVVSRLPGRFSPTEPCLLFLLPVSSAPGGYRPHRPVHCVAPSQGAGRPGHRLVHRAGVAGGPAFLLLVPFLWVCALAGMCCLAALMGEVLTTACALPLRPPGPVVAYLYINDLRYNFGHLKAGACAPPVCPFSGGKDPAPPPPPSGLTDG